MSIEIHKASSPLEELLRDHSYRHRGCLQKIRDAYCKMKKCGAATCESHNAVRMRVLANPEFKHQFLGPDVHDPTLVAEHSQQDRDGWIESRAIAAVEAMIQRVRQLITVLDDAKRFEDDDELKNKSHDEIVRLRDFKTHLKHRRELLIFWREKLDRAILDYPV